MAKPRINALSGETAQIFIGEQVPVIETTVDATGRLSETVTFVDTGIKLEVLPNINAYKKQMRLKIKPEVSLVTGYRGLNNDKPIIKKQM